MNLRLKAVALALVAGAALMIGLVASSASGGKHGSGAFLRPDARTIPGWRIKNASISEWKLAPFQLGNSRIGNNAIQARNIAAGAVTTAAIAAGAVTSADIANGAVGTDQLADGSVTAAKLAAGFADNFFVTDPASTQTVTYGGATVGTVLKLASGATANALTVENSSSTPLFTVSATGSVGTAGSLTATGNLSVGSHGVYSDGGNLTVNGDFVDEYGTIYAEGYNGYGNALSVDGGGLIINAANDAGNFFDVGAGDFTIDSSGNTTIAAGTLTVTHDTQLSTVTTSGQAVLHSLSVTVNAGVGGTLYATGPIDANGATALSVNGGNLTISSAGNLSTAGTIVTASNATVGGYLTVNGADGSGRAILVNGGKFSVKQSNGAFRSDNGLIASDGGGDLAISGYLTASGIDIGNGNLVIDIAGDLTSVGFAHFTGADMHGNSLDVNNGFFTIRHVDGAFAADQNPSLNGGNGGIYSDGHGNLVVGGTLTAGNFAAINLTVTGYETITGVDGVDSNGEALSVDGGGLNVSNVGDNYGDAFSTGNPASPSFYIDTSGNFAAGSGTLSGLEVDGTIALDNSNNVTLSDASLDLNGKFEAFSSDGSFLADQGALNGGIFSDGSGNLNAGGTVTAGSGSSNTTVALLVKGLAAQDVADFKTSAGTLLDKIDSAGRLTLNTASNNINDLMLWSGGGSKDPFQILGVGGVGVLFGVDSSGNASGQTASFTGGSQAGAVGLTVKGSSDGTNPDVADFKVSGGGIGVSVDYLGTLHAFNGEYVTGGLAADSVNSGIVYANFSLADVGNTPALAVYGSTNAGNPDIADFATSGGTTEVSVNYLGELFAKNGESVSNGLASDTIIANGTGANLGGALALYVRGDANGVHPDVAEFATSGGTVKVSVDWTGKLYANSGVAVTNGLQSDSVGVNETGANLGNVIAFYVRGDSNGSHPDIAQFATSGGTVDVSVDYTGKLTAKNGITLQGGDFLIEGDVSHFVSSNGGNPPGIASGAAVGTGSCSINAASSDVRGEVTINVTGGTATGVLCTIAFHKSYAPNSANVILEPVNAAGGQLQGSSANPWIDNVTNIGAQFAIDANGNAVPNGTYIFDYQVIG